MIKLEVVGSKELVNRLQGMQDAVRKRLVFGIREVTERVAETAREKAEAMFKTAGSIVELIETRYEIRGPEYVGYVTSEGKPYLDILHFGGVTRPHNIFPHGKALKFEINGREIFAAHVSHPGSIFQPRPYLSEALIETRTEAVSILERAFNEAIKEAK